MGELNNVLNVYMKKPERIQSVLEYYLNEKLPDDWAETCIEEDGFHSVKNNRGRISFRQRDILKKVVTEKGHYFLGIENQAAANLIFPWRLMQMDCLVYERQIEEIQQRNIQGSVTYTQEDDYLYHYKKDDNLHSLVNLVLYWGKKPWKKPLGISDMSNMRALPKNMRSLHEDYRVRLIDMRRIPDDALERMDSDLKYVLGIIKRADSRKEYEQYISENREYFRRIPKSAVDVLHVCMNIGRMKKLLEYTKAENPEEEERADMCKALEMIEKDAMKRGVKQGVKQGVRQGVRQVIKALVKTCEEFGMSKEKTVDKVSAECSLSRKTAAEYVNQYWSSQTV